MNAVYIGFGIAVLAIAISVGFIQISEADYQQWRPVFAAGEGLAIACGIMLIAFGAVKMMTQ